MHAAPAPARSAARSCGWLAKDTGECVARRERAGRSVVTAWHLACAGLRPVLGLLGGESASPSRLTPSPDHEMWKARALSGFGGQHRERAYDGGLTERGLPPRHTVPGAAVGGAATGARRCARPARRIRTETPTHIRHTGPNR